MYRNFGKRTIDLLISAVLLTLLSPLLILCAIIIKFESPGPVFFRQARVGKGLQTFTLLKFRSMTNEKREVKKIVGKASGVTRFGFLIRRFKVDELPQLINILLGHMSVVGPRPSIPAQLEKLSAVQKGRYDVRPGLTGLAQVSGNILMPWEERIRLDLIYVKNISLLNDIRILLRTVLVVIRGEEKFLGKPLTISKST